MKAIKEIPVGNLTKNAFISYVNLMDDTKTRNEYLQKHWYFTCSCPLCSDPKYDRTIHLEYSRDISVIRIRSKYSHSPIF